jgi:hypothetical protein
VSILDDVALYTFHACLDMDAVMKLSFAVRGSFAHITPTVRKASLDHMKMSHFPPIHGETNKQRKLSDMFPQQPNLALHPPHPLIHLLSHILNHKCRRKKKLNLLCSLPRSRMTLTKILEMPSIIHMRRSIWYLVFLLAIQSSTCSQRKNCRRS